MAPFSLHVTFYITTKRVFFSSFFFYIFHVKFYLVFGSEFGTGSPRIVQELFDRQLYTSSASNALLNRIVKSEFPVDDGALNTAGQSGLDKHRQSCFQPR